MEGRELPIMPLPLVVLAAVAFLAGIVGYVILVQRSFRRLRRVLVDRGYKSPAVLTLSGIAAFIGPLAVGGVLVNVAGYEDAVWPVLSLYLALPLAGAVAARLLPARELRTPGRRVARFPYALAGYGSFGGALSLVGAAVLIGDPRVVRFALPLLISGVTCLAIARRLSTADASAVLEADPRAPVLFLRPFESEESIFIELPRTRLEFLWDWGRNILRHKSKRFMTLEEYLTAEIARAIGPFVALGNPLDFAPPDGAARHYVADDEWMSRFREVVPRSGCIGMIAGDSANIVWELEQIRTMGLHQRLYILTMPQLVEVRRSMAGQLARWWVEMLTKPPDKHLERPVPWSTFARALERAGYEVGDVDPGPGAVLGFDASARAIVLKRRTESAAETVAAIAAVRARSWA